MSADPPTAGLPTAFIARLRQDLGPDAEGVLRSMAEPKRAAYWINPLRAGSVPRLGEPLRGFIGVFTVPAAERALITQSEAATTGRIYPLNPSSVRAVVALDARPGEEILDLAAAPGGKSLLLAAAMQNRGRLAAVEAVKSRFFRMRSNLERCGVAIAHCYLADGRSIGRKTPERFDRVLLDAPCSSEARFRCGEPSSYAHWSGRKNRESAAKQKGLIRSAYRALRPGGRLVYCTCTFAPLENEAIVDYLAARESGAVVHETCRILPDDVWDGFFYAVIEKT